MKTIEVENVGPVKAVKIECPEDGGIIVLRGRNGRGKSKTLEAVESAMTGRGKPELRDGAARGKVEAFGVKMTIGKRLGRSGELEVTSLEGKLDLAALVDPGLKTPEAADARRIKALVQLAGVPADEELFHGLAGGKGEFFKIMAYDSGRPPNMDDLDLPELAAVVKREFEGVARMRETEAAKWEGQEAAMRSAGAGASDTDVDEAALAAALEQAVRDEAAINAQSKAAIEAGYAAAAAKRKLAEAEAAGTGPTLAEAEAANIAATARLRVANNGVQEAAAALITAQKRQAVAEAEQRAAEDQHVAAQQNAKVMAAWREQLTVDQPAVVSLDEIEAAARRVQETRKAVEDGAVNRMKLAHLRNAERSKEQAAKARDEAARLRKAAAGTDGVLSDAVAKAGSLLRVDSGRLVLDTHRGPTHFADLSAGERWRIAIDVAIEAAGAEGVFTIPQEAWESLDPTNRHDLACHVRERRVTVLTAEASDDDEITPELYAAD